MRFDDGVSECAGGRGLGVRTNQLLKNEKKDHVKSINAQSNSEKQIFLLFQQKQHQQQLQLPLLQQQQLRHVPKYVMQ